MAGAKKKEPGFEESLARLEEIVVKLENDELTLEQSIELFEEGVKLAGSCGRRLDETEKKVSLLVKDRQGILSEAPFDSAGEED